MGANPADQPFTHSLFIGHWVWYLLLPGLLLVLSFVPRLIQITKLRRLPLPPGPKGIPLLGNTLQVFSSKVKPWFMYRDLARQYAPNGEMVYLEVLGQPILVIGSLKVAEELLDKRGSIYSDRPLPPSLDMLHMDWAFVIMNYDSQWRAYRRMFHRHYNKSQIHQYTPVLEAQIFKFLRQLRSNPGNFMEDTRYLFVGIIVEISYGLTDPSEVRALSEDAEVLVEAFSDCAQPGHFLVDIFPFLRSVPSWIPGASWKRRLEEVGKLTQYMLRRHFDVVRERSEGTAPEDAQDVAAKIIATLPPKGDLSFLDQEKMGRGTALSGYLAGGDTTISSAYALFAALANHPECQRLAQEELDSVIGSERLPVASDLPQLPYIQALIKELSRWFSVTPMGIPHLTSQDDTYEGYFIPKGTTVIGNSWAIMHDPDIFEDPLEFKPERYLMHDPDTQQLKINPAVLDPESAAFGFGRRICPGRHLSIEALMLMAASLLSVFNVNAPKDASGRSTKLKMETIGRGVVVSPAPFEVDIVPRSTRHTALLREE